MAHPCRNRADGRQNVVFLRPGAGPGPFFDRGFVRFGYATQSAMEGGTALGATVVLPPSGK